MTNGEKIKEIFPNIDNRLDAKTGIMIVKWVDNTTKFFKTSWWNAEYKEPTTKNDLGVDCIDRDSAIKALDYDIKCFEFKSGVSKHMDDIAKLLNTIYENQVNNIKALPSLTPIRPKGYWREVDTNMYACSNCSHVLTIDPLDNSILEMNTCPFCSAQMESEEE